MWQCGGVLVVVVFLFLCLLWSLGSMPNRQQHYQNVKKEFPLLVHILTFTIQSTFTEHWELCSKAKIKSCKHSLVWFQISSCFQHNYPRASLSWFKITTVFDLWRCHYVKVPQAVNQSVCLSGMITGAAAATVYYNLKLRHPTLELPIIDYDLALLFQPMLVLGISLGVALNVIFADWTITILLIILFIGMMMLEFSPC